MFTARFRKYWNDFISEYVEIRTNSINEILEYAYKVHKDSVYPTVSRFDCVGKSKYSEGGWLNVNFALKERMGNRGSLWLERITYHGDKGDVLVFGKNDDYISPKTAKAFDDFAQVVKKREENKFGEF